MKQFFKFMFASMAGFVLAMGVVFIFFLIIVSVLVSSLESKKITNVGSNTILEISLGQPLTERTPNNPFKNFDFSNGSSKSQPGVYDIVKSIEHAATDKNIKGIYLHVENISGHMASVEEIRNALLRFKNSKKFVIAYSEYYTQNAYYLCSVADQIYLNPIGLVDWRGYATQLAFFKGTLEKLEIEPEVIRHGKFKSAVEPFIADHMSDENRAQIKEFVDDFWNHTKDEIAKSRHKTTDELQALADSGSLENADLAVKFGFADKLMYEDEVMQILKEKSGTKDSKPKFVSLDKYNDAPNKSEYSKDKIAVIYASGEIGSGKGDDESIGSETTCEAIRKARLDKNIKAIVFRVNSPGGSALASEVIWREVALAKKEKPVVVSMGDLAASGGYYISCVANKIVAQPNTITGSIGVFGLMMNMQKMFNNKLGVTFDTYKTGQFADMGLPTRALTPAERQKIQNEIEQIYGTFTQRVADGRNMKQADVDSIGQGRVWSGVDALRLGLVDTLGNMDDAIHIAANLAKLSKYRITELPEQKDVMEEFLKSVSADAKSQFVKDELGENAKYFDVLKHVSKMQGIQARLVYDFMIN